MRADEGLAAGVVEVALHQEVEEVGGVAADAAQLGVAALQNLVAQRRTHVSPAVEKRTRELEQRERGRERKRERKRERERERERERGVG